MQLDRDLAALRSPALHWKEKVHLDRRAPEIERIWGQYQEARRRQEALTRSQQAIIAIPDPDANACRPKPGTVTPVDPEHRPLWRRLMFWRR